MSSPLRRMQRQAGFVRQKIAMAAAYALYVETEAQAGRVPMGKRRWRESVAQSPLRVASE